MIRVIAICLFLHDRRLLVTEGVDTTTGERFARPLGGGLEPGEHSSAALAREIREELHQEIRDLHLLGVLENHFTYEGKPGHEIVFVYDGRFADTSLYQLDQLPFFEPGWPSAPRWRHLDSFHGDCKLVPAGLLALLKHTEPPSPSAAGD